VGRLGIAGDTLFALGWRGRIAGHVTIPKQRIGHHFEGVNGPG